MNTSRSFKVILTDGRGIRVQADNKTEAAALAISRAVQIAQTLNAKYAAQNAAFGVSWADESEDASSYTVRTVRKLPTAS